MRTDRTRYSVAVPKTVNTVPRLVRNALTVAQVRAARKPGILVDGNGLMLRIQSAGAKSWVQRIVIHGKRRDIGLGAADLVSLAEAREAAARNRAIARNGGDPRRPRVPSFRDAEAEAFERAALDWKGGVDSPTTELLFSTASIWEVVIKNALGRRDFRIEPRQLRDGLIQNGYSELAIRSEHALAVGLLPPIHTDPFDRILIAQAQVENITLLTTDNKLARYPGPIQAV